MKVYITLRGRWLDSPEDMEFFIASKCIRLLDSSNILHKATSLAETTAYEYESKYIITKIEITIG